MNSNPRRLYRSADDRMLAGVAGGLAAYLDVDPVIVRVIWAVSVIVSAGMTALAYLVMIVVVPLEPADWPNQPYQSPWMPAGSPGSADPYAGVPSDTPTGTVSSETWTPDANAGGDATTQVPGWGPQAGGPNAAGFASVPGQPSRSWGDWRSQGQQERWQHRAERWQQREAGRESRRPGLMIGVVLIVIGGLLAAHQFDPRFDLNVTWPFVLIGIGCLIVASAVRIKRD